MSETTIPSRIRHLGVCTHPQTPAARRACRKATIAAAQAAPAAPQHKAGDEIQVGDVTVILIAKRRFGGAGTGWSWATEDRSAYGELTYPTAEDAIDHARRTLGRRCRCGAPATMTASLGPACIDCYDTLAA